MMKPGYATCWTPSSGSGSCQRTKELKELTPDNETALALTRLLEILGEAAGRVSPNLKARHPEIPWTDISDTRNIIIHEYFDVDMEVVESIVVDDLPPLAQQLEVMLEEIATREDT